MATIARINPEPGLTKKLTIAAANAISEGMLKCALVCTVSMGERTLPASVLEGRSEPQVEEA
jgi:hypothetical protein